MAYSDEELLDQIRELTKANGGTLPTWNEFQEHPDTASPNTIANRFGSYSAGILEAGYTPNSPGGKNEYTNEDLLDQIDELTEANGGTPPTSREFQEHPDTASPNTIANRFGSYSAGVLKAGYTPDSRRGENEDTDEDLLDQISELTEANEGTPPTTEEFSDHPETASPDTIAKRFGSYNAGVLEAGYNPHPVGRARKYTDEDLLDQIRELTGANGGTPPTTEEFSDHPETVAARTVRDRFGTWNKAIKQAGYEPESLGTPSRRELLSALQQAVSDQGVEHISHFKTSGDGSFPSLRTYERRFGGAHVAAIRGSIDINQSGRLRAVPFTPSELRQFVDLIPQLDPDEQAIALVSLLTGCEKDEHRWVSKIGIDETATDPLIVFPSDSKRGARTVSIGPLHSQFVREFEPIEPSRIRQSIEFSSYPYSAIQILRRIARRIDFDVDRQVIGEKSKRGPQVLHRDLRCTHYLFEYTRGASQAWLADRLALTDSEIRHYHRFLDNPTDPDIDGWSVAINWRD